LLGESRAGRRPPSVGPEEARNTTTIATHAAHDDRYSCGFSPPHALFRTKTEGL
jgi:hypothetical protein